MPSQLQERKMKKGLLLGIILTGCSAWLFAGGGGETAGSSGERIVKFKFVGINQSALLSEFEIKMAQTMREKSRGTLVPKTFFDGQLGTNDEDLCSGLSEENYEMPVNAEWFWTWAAPEWMGYYRIPFAFRDSNHLITFLKSDVIKELNRLVR
jgi:TRAP-type C4-dicarboxylate transport system substrate-binding protein